MHKAVWFVKIFALLYASFSLTGGTHDVLLPVHSSDRYQNCEHDILKTNEPVLMQSAGQGHKKRNCYTFIEKS